MEKVGEFAAERSMAKGHYFLMVGQTDVRSGTEHGPGIRSAFRDYPA